MFTRDDLTPLPWPRRYVLLRRHVFRGAECRNLVQGWRGRKESRRARSDGWRRWCAAQLPDLGVDAGARAAGGGRSGMDVERTTELRRTRGLVPWIAGVALVAVVTMVAAYGLVRSGGMEAYGYSAPLLHAVAALSTNGISAVRVP
jgi:hypothetical protein